MNGSLAEPFRPRVTFVTAMLNEAHRIDKCLASIRNQDYPQSLVDILIADGRSSDDTVARAESYGARVFDNPEIRCEPGVAAMMGKVEEGLIVVFAADNTLVGTDWLRRVVEVFADERVVASFCSPAYDRSGGSITNRYLNRFTDPVNHFTYWDGADYPNLKRSCAKQLSHRRDGVAYFRFERMHSPLVALAQGTAVRAPFVRPPGTEYVDVEPFVELAARGLTAYMEELHVTHASVTGLGHVLRKFRPRYREKLFVDPVGIKRLPILNAGRLLRRKLWPIYGLSVTAPLATGIVMAIRKREPLWLFHPVITVAMAYAFVLETIDALPAVLRSRFAVPQRRTE